MSVEILEMLANTCQTLKYVRFGCSLCSGCSPGIEHLWMMIRFGTVWNIKDGVGRQEMNF